MQLRRVELTSSRLEVARSTDWATGEEKIWTKIKIVNDMTNVSLMPEKGLGIYPLVTLGNVELLIRLLTEMHQTFLPVCMVQSCHTSCVRLHSFRHDFFIEIMKCQHMCQLHISISSKKRYDFSTRNLMYCLSTKYRYR